MRRARASHQWLLVPFLAVVAWVFVPAQSQEHAPRTVSLDALLADLKSAPKTNDEREKKLVELYLQAGAKPEEIKLVDVYLNGQVAGHNVVVTKPGETKSFIVLGGHLDKVAVGDGIIDDWSGCVIAKNVYQALRETKTKHSLVFVGFTMEERGLVGSRQFVASLSEEEKKSIVAMANFECFGVGGPHIWANVADERLKALAHKVAQELKIDLTEHTIPGTGADSVPFARAGIASLTLDGLPTDKMRLIHSVNDNFGSIIPESYHTGYQLSLEFVRALDRIGVN